MNKKLPYDRFFAFGCSFTNWIWPTWADILSKDTGLPLKNLGYGGMGNVGIQSKIILTDLEDRFTSNDLLIIMWSSWIRQDFYAKDEGWMLGGNVFNNPFYDRKYLEKYWSLENDYIKNISAILAIQKAYRGIIKFEGSMNDFGCSEIYFDQDIVSHKGKLITEKLLKLFNTNSNEISIFDNTHNSNYNGQCLDAHPDILTHLNYVQQFVCPKLGITLDSSTVDTCKNYFRDAEKLVKPNYTYAEITPIFYELNEKYGFEKKINVVEVEI